MKEKILLEDINTMSLSELTDLATKIIDELEHEEDLEKSIETYQRLLKVNSLIEKTFQKDSKEINEKTKIRIKEIKKNNEKKIK